MIPTPTSADFKARYPEFIGVADSVVTMVIDEVKGMVDEGWELSDQKPGILALAAHQLTLEGYPARSGGAGGGSGGTFDPTNRPVLSRKVGDVAVTYGRTDNARGDGGGAGYDYSSTIYGRAFLRLLRLNAPAVGLV